MYFMTRLLLPAYLIFLIMPAVSYSSISPVAGVLPDIQAVIVPSNISSEQAAVLALNRVDEEGEGIVLQQQQHTLVFTDHGMALLPKNGPAWQWQLDYVGSADKKYTANKINKDRTISPSNLPGQIEYQHMGITERYVIKSHTVEQQFIIHQPLSIGGSDLLVVGNIETAVNVEATEQGWQWRDASGVVKLGKVTVLDAMGVKIPAMMEVTSSSTRIQVNGKALGTAHYPVTIDPEIGSNDFRISYMGFGDDYDAASPAIAFNVTNNEYFVVWEGDDNLAPLVDEENEIYGQRIKAATGALIGGPILISDMGPNGNSSYDASSPAVAYNVKNNEYLVVWQGDDVLDEFEIYGQRIAAATGKVIGINDFRISDMGAVSEVNNSYGAYAPAIAYNVTDNEYLVVWEGDIKFVPSTNIEREIFGQRIDAKTGAETGVNFRISEMGADDNSAFGASMPDVAYGLVTDVVASPPVVIFSEYLVVWQGDDLNDDEFEIYGQRIRGGYDVMLSDEVGTNDFSISEMGPVGDTNYNTYGASNPAITYGLVTDVVTDVDTKVTTTVVVSSEYLVVWQGDDLIDGEFEIYGQRIVAATGAEIGTNDFRISDMGTGTDGVGGYVATAYGAFSPAVSFNSTDNEYLVIWEGDDNTGLLVDGETEIYGQRIDAETGAETGSDDFRLSDMGPDGDVLYGASGSVLGYDTTDNQYFVAWRGDDSTSEVVDDEFEIFGQRIAFTGDVLGSNDLRISVMGHDDGYAAEQPAVAHNTTDNEYLVVWQGDDNAGSLVNDEFEIFGQRIDGITGAEIGADFRISHMGPDGNVSYGAYAPAVAYNETNNEYLVVWQGDDNTTPLIDNEREIFGQRIRKNNIDPTQSDLIGNNFRISDMGPDKDISYSAALPAVAYNVTNNEYLVVWQGDDNSGTLVDDENEIFVQRLDAADGTEIGANDSRISDMGPDGDISYDAFRPAVSYNSRNKEYLVVWQGDDDNFSMMDDEFEIFGQRLNAENGSEVGDNDFRISDMGYKGTDFYDAVRPAIAYNETNNEYLVVWEGNEYSPDLVSDEFEIFGQRLVAGTGAEVGDNDFRISDLGRDYASAYNATAPSVAYKILSNEYLVVWSGDDNTFRLVDNEIEIFGQRVNASNGHQVGDNDFRISDMGPDRDVNYGAGKVAVVYNALNYEFLVVWEGGDDTAPMVQGEKEIFGQRLLTGVAAINFSQPSYRVLEGVGTITVTVERFGDYSGSTITLDYMTEDSSAVASQDYTAISGQLTFQANETTKTLDVAVIDDSEDESDELMRIVLSNAVSNNGQVQFTTGGNIIELHILDNDEPAEPASDTGGGVGALGWYMMLMMFVLFFRRIRCFIRLDMQT